MYLDFHKGCHQCELDKVRNQFQVSSRLCNPSTLQPTENPRAHEQDVKWPCGPVPSLLPPLLTMSPSKLCINKLWFLGGRGFWQFSRYSAPPLQDGNLFSILLMELIINIIKLITQLLMWINACQAWYITFLLYFSSVVWWETSLLVLQQKTRLEACFRP